MKLFRINVNLLQYKYGIDFSVLNLRNAFVLKLRNVLFLQRSRYSFSHMHNIWCCQPGLPRCSEKNKIGYTENWMAARRYRYSGGIITWYVHLLGENVSKRRFLLRGVNWFSRMSSRWVSFLKIYSLNSLDFFLHCNSTFDLINCIMIALRADLNVCVSRTRKWIVVIAVH